MGLLNPSEGGFVNSVTDGFLDGIFEPLPVMFNFIAKLYYHKTPHQTKKNVISEHSLLKKTTKN